jgi:hypothetical protein
MILPAQAAPPNFGTQGTTLLGSHYAAFTAAAHQTALLDYIVVYEQIINQTQPFRPPETTESWVIEDRPIEAEKNECPILYITIGIGNTYCRCAACKNCFDAEALKEALKKGGAHCPMCRGPWKDWFVYTNTAQAATAAIATAVVAIPVTPSSWWRRFFSCFRRRFHSPPL